MSNEKCTVLVCSCDDYADLWDPFFRLFKKYWADCPYDIVLNTGHKTYEYEGLNIKTFGLFDDDRALPYGERLLAHLKKIETPYTLLLMDDFFMYDYVAQSEIDEIIGWLDQDEKAEVFCFQNVIDEQNTPSERYPNYLLRPKVSSKKYKFQASIWRTDKLISEWRKHESPWQWEVIGNIRSFQSEYDFYVVTDNAQSPIKYLYTPTGSGITHGRWYVDLVDDLFRGNEIFIDYSQRGIFDPDTYRAKKNTKHFFTETVCCFRSLGLSKYAILYIVYKLRSIFRRTVTHKKEGTFVDFLRKKA